MATEELIPVQLFCTHHNIEISFVADLYQNGLVEIIRKEETEFIELSKIESLERLVRLRYDLDINMEGIDVVTNLLKRLNELQDELATVKNRLRRFEAQSSH
jgi:uncharacterized membrane protein YjjP (DUF1212 family)